MFSTINRPEQIRQEMRAIQSDISIAKFRLLQSLQKDMGYDAYDFGMRPGGETDFCDVQMCAEIIKISAEMLDKLTKELAGYKVSIM